MELEKKVLKIMSKYLQGRMTLEECKEELFDKVLEKIQDLNPDEFDEVMKS